LAAGDEHDVLIGRVLANRYRVDLEQGGIGNGQARLRVRFPE
jgi:hypothetical protein